MISKVTPLAHKARYYAVEGRALVAVALLVSTQASEVLKKTTFFVILIRISSIAIKQRNILIWRGEEN